MVVVVVMMTMMTTMTTVVVMALTLTLPCAARQCTGPCGTI